MTFSFSKRSLNNMQGVRPDLVEVAHRALARSTVDFAVTEGRRSVARQKQLVASGASQTMNSKHIEGKAIDVVAYIGSRVSWELPLYCEIAEAFRQAARELEIPVRWGGAWNVGDIRTWSDSMEHAMLAYVDARRKAGKKPFIDGPHFEVD